MLGAEPRRVGGDRLSIGDHQGYVQTDGHKGYERRAVKPGIGHPVSRIQPASYQVAPGGRLWRVLRPARYGAGHVSCY